MSSRIRINRGAESDGGVPGINKEHRSNYVMFVDIDPHKVFEIIADNPGFVSPFSEPYGYYMYFSAHDSEKDIDKSACETLYLSKLRYAEKSRDSLIKTALRTLSGKINIAEDIRLVFDSFVLAPDDKELAAALSDRENMSGHYIECRWALDWELNFAEYC